MIRFKIKEFVLAMGNEYPARWLVKNCGFKKTKAFNLINSKQASIRLEDLALLCENLNCSTNELFYWEQRPGHILPEGHPCLTQLTPPDGHGDWNHIFKKLSPEKILELRNIAIDKMKEE